MPPNLIENLDIIVFLKRVKIGKAYLRRINNILEIEKYDKEKNKIIANEVFRWNSEFDKYESMSGSILLENLSKALSIDKESIREEIENRVKVLEWLKDRNIRDYREFGKIIRMYYANSEELIKTIRGY